MQGGVGGQVRGRSVCDDRAHILDRFQDVLKPIAKAGRHDQNTLIKSSAIRSVIRGVSSLRNVTCVSKPVVS